MQGIEGFPEDRTVATPRAVVTLDGQPIEVDSLSLDSEIGSAMPAQAAAAGGGIVAATGDMTVLPDDDSVRVVDGGPWGVGFSAHQDVTIDVGYGAALARQFTGRVDGFSGSPLRGSQDLQLIDDSDVFDQRVTIEPLMSAMPAREGSGYRLISLNPMYITDRVLRACGFYATPQAFGECVFSAPLMGSVWPEIGIVNDARSVTNPSDEGPHHVNTHWGVGVRNAEVEWVPNLSQHSGVLDRSFQMIFVVGYQPSASSSVRWTCWWGDYGIRVQVDSARQIYARVMHDETVLGEVTISAALVEDADVFTARIRPNGDIELHASNGVVESAQVSLPSQIRTTPMNRITLLGNAGTIPVGGFQASFSSWNGHRVPRTAHLSPPAFSWVIQATPGWAGVPARDILKSQAAAELAAMWVDEHGHFRWVNRNILETSSPSGVLTSTSTLLDLPWEYPVKSEFSRVEVTSQFPNRSYSRNTKLTAWQGSNQSMDQDDDSTVIIEVPTDEDWYDVAIPVRMPVTSAAEIRRGGGSHMGGVLTRDGEDDAWASASQLQQEFRRINHSTFAIESRANPPAGWTIEQRFMDSVYGRFNGERLPILRIRARVKWEDRTHTSSVTGPTGRPILQHDVRHWVQSPSQVQELADWIAERVTIATPILRDVPIVPDPRIQKGDVYWLDDSDAYQVRLRVLVMGTNLRFESGPPAQLSQTITCRILTVQRIGTTLTEHDRVWEDTTLTAHDDYWADSTLREHDADPLRRD